MNRIWLLCGAMLICLLLTQCSYERDLKSSLSDEEIIAYDFSEALLEHDPVAYELTATEAHDFLDEWFAATNASKCHHPQILHGGVTEEGENFTIRRYTTLCQGSDPPCSRIQFESLHISSQIVDGERQLKVDKWWDRVELCDSDKKFESIVISPLRYLKTPYSD